MTAQTNGRTYAFGIRDRLRIAREQAGYDQAEFANVTGLSRGTISNYERGITPPRRPALLAWAMATGFDRDWLETGEHSNDGGPETGLKSSPGRRHVDTGV
jgi:transcriptional regulator with XRE-family HTH domain